MAVTLTLTGKTPGTPQFGLATFTEHYKCDATADLVLIDGSVPQNGDAHPDYQFMFVTDRYCSETGESASALDLVYMGSLTGLDDAPVLPPIKHDSTRQRQSATTYTSSAIFPAVATVPGSIKYYSPTNTITLFSTEATTDEVPDDPADMTVEDLISWTLAAEQPASSFPEIATFLVEEAFVQRTVTTSDATEIVTGQYWQITKSKTKQFFPYAPPE